jgi:predicted dehydrogenase
MTAGAQALPAAKLAPYPGNVHLRCALIGYGAWGAHHARAISQNPEAQLVAIAARTEATQAKAGQEHPSCKVYGDYMVEDIPIPRAAGEVFELEDQFARFVRCIQGEGPPAATGVDGEWSVRLCLAAQESVQRGTPVAID